MVFAGLSRTFGTRGRVQIAGRDFGLWEQQLHEAFDPAILAGGAPLCAWRDGNFVLLTRTGDVRPHDRVLWLLPIWKLRKGPAGGARDP